MSAFIAIAKRDAAYLLADAASTMPDGRMRAAASKIVCSGQIRCAITCRGAVLLSRSGTTYSIGTSMMSIAEQRQLSFDQLVRDFDDVHDQAMKEWTSAVTDHFGDHWRHHDLALIGWSSERELPEAYSFSTMDNGSTVDDSGGVVPAAANFLFPEKFTMAGPVPTRDDLLAAGFTAPDPDDFDPRIDGLALLEAMRQRRAPLFSNGTPIYAVGAFVELATVTRDGVNCEVIHRWPDQIGQLINPKAAPLAAA